MKIPGLDEITANMNKFADMLPVMESIDSNLKTMVALQAMLIRMQSQERSASYRTEIFRDLDKLGV